MSTTSKSSPNDFFRLIEQGHRKTARSISPINDDLALTHNLGTPKTAVSLGGLVTMMLDQVRILSHRMRLFGIHEACERQAQIALIKAKVLIPDDLGLRNYTHEEATSMMMDMLEERYRKIPLIVTSQVEPPGWLKLFEDPVIAEAIVVD